MRKGYEGEVWDAPMVCPAKHVSLLSSQFLEARLSGDDVSMSVEKSSHASSQAVSKVC